MAVKFIPMTLSSTNNCYICGNYNWWKYKYCIEEHDKYAIDIKVYLLTPDTEVKIGPEMWCGVQSNDN